jgi:hypothetical protein
MHIRKLTHAVVGLVAPLLVCAAACAAVSEDELAQLGTTLTP